MTTTATKIGGADVGRRRRRSRGRRDARGVVAVINCDCVYEPLYGKRCVCSLSVDCFFFCGSSGEPFLRAGLCLFFLSSRQLASVERNDRRAAQGQSRLVVSSMERRVADGIDGFLDEMRKMDHVGGVEITPALQHTNGTTGDGRICEARRDREHRRSGGDECEYDRDENRRNDNQPPFPPRP